MVLVPLGRGEHSHQLATLDAFNDTIRAILPELERRAQRERNSLVVVTQQIQSAVCAEQQPADPDSSGATI
jgi:hypothetical protein